MPETREGGSLRAGVGIGDGLLIAEKVLAGAEYQVRARLDSEMSLQAFRQTPYCEYGFCGRIRRKHVG